MRFRFLHVLAVLLIAVSAIAAPAPAGARCVTCVDCTAVAPATNETPCPENNRVCQIAQTCAPQLQKMPAMAMTFGDPTSGGAAFGEAEAIAIKPGFVKPETSPPRT